MRRTEVGQRSFRARAAHPTFAHTPTLSFSGCNHLIADLSVKAARARRSDKLISLKIGRCSRILHWAKVVLLLHFFNIFTTGCVSSGEGLAALPIDVATCDSNWRNDEPILTDRYFIICAGDDIQSADYIRISYLMVQNHTKLTPLLLVDSDGGDAAAAINIASMLSSGYGYDIVVRGICFSSCANYFFLAANKKFIIEEAQVGWHGGLIRSREELKSVILPDTVEGFQTWNNQELSYEAAIDQAWEAVQQTLFAEINLLKEEGAARDIIYLFDQAIKCANVGNVERAVWRPGAGDFYKIFGVDGVTFFGRRMVQHPVIIEYDSDLVRAKFRRLNARCLYDRFVQER